MPEPSRARAKVIRRLRYLWTFELFDSFFLPAVAILVARINGLRVGYFAIYGMTATAFLLWQGSAYWWMKLRAVRRGAQLEADQLRLFAIFKRLNWIVLALPPLVLPLSIGLPGRLRGFDLLLGGLFYLLALLEQINYYYYQLMYETRADWRYLKRHRRLKRASLARALDRRSDRV